MHTRLCLCVEKVSKTYLSSTSERGLHSRSAGALSQQRCVTAWSVCGLRALNAHEWLTFHFDGLAKSHPVIACPSRFLVTAQAFCSQQQQSTASSLFTKLLLFMTSYIGNKLTPEAVTTTVSDIEA